MRRGGVGHKIGIRRAGNGFLHNRPGAFFASRTAGLAGEGGGAAPSRRHAGQGVPPPELLSRFPQPRHRLDVEGVREHVQRLHLLEPVARLDQLLQVARERGRVAGHIDQVRRRGGEQQAVMRLRVQARPRGDPRRPGPPVPRAKCRADPLGLRADHPDVGQRRSAPRSAAPRPRTAHGLDAQHLRRGGGQVDGDRARSPRRGPPRSRRTAAPPPSREPARTAARPAACWSGKRSPGRSRREIRSGVRGSAPARRARRVEPGGADSGHLGVKAGQHGGREIPERRRAVVRRPGAARRRADEPSARP